MKSRRRTNLWLLLLLLWLAGMPQLQACATCFGASDSDQARGMNMGILSLLAVVVVVLSGFAAFFIFLARRAAAINGSPTAVNSGHAVPVQTSLRS